MISEIHSDVNNIIVNEKLLEEDFLEIISRTIRNIGIQSDLTIDTELQSLGINSMVFIQLIVDLEKVFDIEFDDEKLSLDAFKTINGLYDFIINSSTENK